MQKYEEYEYAKTPQARYDKKYTTFISLRLEREADADIIKALDGKAKQTEVKRLVRLGLGKIRYEEKRAREKQELEEKAKLKSE